MRTYETFDHTADVGLVIRGRTLEELFANAADALVDLTIDPAGLEEKIHKTITVSAADLEALLVAWLNELLYVLDADGFLPRRVRIANLNDTALTAELTGDTVDPNRHTVRRLVKAATYHGLSLSRTNGLWEARMILDL
ncbi:MAG: archease [Bacillati bacterium ANGP1]|uniref:Archease n=1 Tax=Candidatus Segetimicrobium genomatis TaxID=2569760 RepID=A0A537K2T6_9BACT|nr:MAG: archease [Terrabacteria group bacterium ANGP1]